MVIAYGEIERARLLLDAFSKKGSEFNQLTKLSEALTILSDLITSDENEAIKKTAVTLMRTHKRHLLQRINYALTNPREFTYQQWEYFDKATDDFIGTEPDKDKDLTKLQAEIQGQKYLARYEELSEKEQLHMLLDTYNSLSEEEKKELAEQIKNKKNNDG